VEGKEPGSRVRGAGAHLPLVENGRAEGAQINAGGKGGGFGEFEERRHFWVVFGIVSAVGQIRQPAERIWKRGQMGTS